MYKLWIILLSVSLTASAQSTIRTNVADVKFGSTFKANVSYNIIDIYGPFGKELITYSVLPTRTGYGKSAYLLQQFGENLALKKEEEFHTIQLAFATKFIEGIVKLDSKYISVLSEVVDGRAGIDNLSIQYFDPDKMEFPGEPFNLLTTQAEKTNLGARLTWGSGISYTVSASPKGKSGLVTIHQEYKGKTGESLGLIVFNSSLTADWGQFVDLELKGKEADLVQSGISDNGDVFAIIRVWSMGSRRWSQGDIIKSYPTFHHKLICITNNGQDIASFDLGIKGKYLTDATLVAYDNPNKVMLAGMYGELAKDDLAHKGVYVLTIDVEEGVLVKESYKGIPATHFMPRATTKREEKMLVRRGVPKFAPFEMDDVLAYPDGSFLLTGQQYNIEFYDGADNRYYFGGMLAARIDANGEIQFATMVPRSSWQTRTNMEMGYFARAIVDDKVYFVYSCHTANFPEFKSQTASELITGTTVVATAEISPDGMVKRYKLFDHKKVKQKILVSKYVQVSGNELRVFARDGNEFRLVQFSFK